MPSALDDAVVGAVGFVGGAGALGALGVLGAKGAFACVAALGRVTAEAAGGEAGMSGNGVPQRRQNCASSRFSAWQAGQVFAIRSSIKGARHDTVEHGAPQTAVPRMRGGARTCIVRACEHAARPHRVAHQGHDVGYAILRSIHLLGVIAWVGGMFFAVACLRPAAGELEPPQRVALMRRALGRFLDIAGVAVLLVLASGAWMMGTATRTSVKAGIGFTMPIDWLVMAVLGVAMAVVYGYIRLGPWRRLVQAADARAWPDAASALARIRTLVVLNVVLAVVIVIVTRLGAIA